MKSPNKQKNAIFRIYKNNSPSKGIFHTKKIKDPMESSINSDVNINQSSDSYNSQLVYNKPNTH